MLSPCIRGIVWMAIAGWLTADSTPYRLEASFFPGQTWIPNLFSGPEATNPAKNPHPQEGRQAYQQQKFRHLHAQEIPANIRAQELAFARSLQPIGPNREEPWTLRSLGPNHLGGRTRALAVDVRDDNIVLAGGVSGGVWKSGDQGNSWTYATRPDQVPSVSCILQDLRPGHQDTWYYGTGELIGNTANSAFAPFRGDGIFKSGNNGESWEQIPATATGRLSSPLPSTAFNYINGLAQDVSNLNQPELYAAVAKGILRSTDGFNTNNRVLSVPDTDPNGQYTEVICTPNGTVYATISKETSTSGSGKSGIFRSTNGTSWVNITPSNGYESTFRRIVMAYSPSDPNVVYFLGDTPKGARLHRYQANLGSWTDLSDNIPAFGGAVGNYNAQNSYNMVVAVHPTNPDLVLLGGTNLYLSTDGFSTSNNIRWIGGYSLNNDFSHYDNHHADQHVLAFDSQGKLFSGHDGGVSSTEDLLGRPVRWTSLNSGFQTTQVYAVAQSNLNKGSTIRVAGMQDNSTFLLTDQSRDGEWLEVGRSDGGFCALTPSALIISWQYGRLYRYGYHPITGQPRPNDEVSLHLPNEGNSEYYAYLTPWAVDPVRPNRLFVGSRDGVYVLENVTENPTSEDWKLRGNATLVGTVSALAMGETQPVLWVGTSVGKLYRESNHLQPQEEFEDFTPDIFPSGGYISSVAVHPLRDSEVWVTFSNYGEQSVFRTLDGGTTWEAVGGNLESDTQSSGEGPAATWIAIALEGTETHYFLGTSIGLFHTQNPDQDRTFWTQVGAEEIGWALIDMISVNQTDGTVLIGTHGKGVYELNLPQGGGPRTVLLGEPSLCANEPSLLLATRGSDGPYLYQWYRNGELIPGANSYELYTNQPGTYQVSLRNGVDSVGTNAVTLSGRVPNIELLLRNDTLFTEPSCNDCQYSWVRLGEGVVRNTNKPNLYIGDQLLSGSYQVEVSNGCSQTVSNALEVEGFDLPSNKYNLLIISPNPVESTASLRLIKPKGQVLEARLVTLQGQLIDRKVGSGWNTWDMRAIPAGRYIFQIIGADFVSSALVIKR